jgi:hypothetical protein
MKGYIPVPNIEFNKLLLKYYKTFKITTFDKLKILEEKYLIHINNCI